jgi:hypothetical protein
MTDVRIAAAYCPDKPCILYPMTTTMRAEDPTLPSLYMAIVESTSTTAAELNRVLGKSKTYVGKLIEQQRSRWSKFS